MEEISITITLSDHRAEQLRRIAREVTGQDTATAKANTLGVIATSGLDARMDLYEDRAKRCAENRRQREKDCRQAVRKEAAQQAKRLEKLGMAEADFGCEPLPTPEEEWAGC